LFLCGAESAEAIPFLFGLATVTFDGVFQRQGLAIVHMPRVHAKSPQRHGTQFVGGVLRRILHDAIAGSDVVQQEVAVGMDALIPQSLWHGERSAVDYLGSPQVP
jgi:hypothetical protein